MGPGRLDRRVTKEARWLVREARSALDRRTGDTDGKLLKARMEAVATPLGAGDLAAVRRGLPALDAMVDKLAVAGRKSSWREYVESIGVAVLIAFMLRAFVVEAFKIPSASMIPTMQIGDFIFVNKFLYGVRVPYTRTKLFEVRKPERGEVIVFMNPCTPERDFIKRIVAVAGDTVEVRCNVLYINSRPVQDTYVDKPCEYWDYDDHTHEWFKNTDPDPYRGKPCSHYVTKLGGYTFDTYHDADRPQRTTEPDDHDFPQVPDTDLERLQHGDGQPYCTEDHRTPEERARSTGKIEKSTPIAGGPSGACALSYHYVVPPDHVFCMGDNRANSADSRSWGPVPLDHIKGKAMFVWFSYGSPVGIRYSRVGNFVH